MNILFVSDQLRKLQNILMYIGNTNYKFISFWIYHANLVSFFLCLANFIQRTDFKDINKLQTYTEPWVYGEFAWRHSSGELMATLIRRGVTYSARHGRPLPCHIIKHPMSSRHGRQSRDNKFDDGDLTPTWLTNIQDPWFYDESVWRQWCSEKRRKKAMDVLRNVPA